jgi:lysophospholipase L1-like esterase
VLATIAPVEPGTFTQTIVSEALPRLNETIKDMGETIIDLNEQMIGSHLTTDGVHLNAQGYTLWTKAIIEGIKKGLGCGA